MESKELRYCKNSNKTFTWEDYLNDWRKNDTTAEFIVKDEFNRLPIVGYIKENYDSSADTLNHIKRVNSLLLEMCTLFIHRANNHDNSKLEYPEKELFDKYTPLLKELKYGTPEYEESLNLLKPALEHHYKNNSHHPEFYKDGIDGMNLIDLVEMICDWKAATERTKDGDIYKSIEINSKRFNMSEQLKNICINTLKIMGW